MPWELKPLIANGAVKTLEPLAEAGAASPSISPICCPGARVAAEQPSGRKAVAEIAFEGTFS